MTISPQTSNAGPPSVGLALQGGGTHGAFTWGVLDRLLDEVAQGRLRIAGISGSSAGAINAALVVGGLAIGGPEAARKRLRAFWEGLSRRGSLLGNALFGFADPGTFGFDIDWSPGAIFLEAVGLVVSPYTNPFYSDALAPLIREALPDAELAALNASAIKIFVCATNVNTNGREIFTQPRITRDTLRASAALPQEFRAVQIGAATYWDGGYIGNPALDPLIDVSKDLLLVLVNPFRYDKLPISAREILDRLNQITFNASVVLEVNAIEAVNRVLAAVGVPADAKYAPVRFHMIRNDKFLETLGFVSKSSTSRELIMTLFAKGREAAEDWIKAHRHRLGSESSVDAHAELVGPVLKGQRAP
jgi:NTE family protein